MDTQIDLAKYLLAFIQGLKEAGVSQAVISPGSRSTPLAIMLHRDPAITTYLDVDERSAAFFGLGLTKVNQQPVALVCTSGSAAANYYPAICEAEATNQPLIVLTTDRPAELQGVGAPQAMDQVNLYASHVKKMVQLALPEASATMLAYAHWQAFATTSQALIKPKGPVQINLPFREPLLPADPALITSQKLQPIKRLAPQRQVELTALKSLFEQPGLIIVGEERSKQEAQLLMRLAAKLNWPLLGDPLTNLGDHEQNIAYLHQADLIFQAKVPTQAVILRFGRLPVTKPVMQWLTKQTCPTILVEDGSQMKDQLHQANYLIDSSVANFLAGINDLNLTPVKDDWKQKWQNYQRLAEAVVQEHVAKLPWGHSAVAALLGRQLKRQNLFLANSNSIRLVDRLSVAEDQTVQTYGNRGVNGIDGLNSTVAGITTASQQATTLLIGDLAFFHDMNGLAMIKRYQLPVTVVLLNNNGGGIFAFLSQSQLPQAEFTALFGTPQDLNFKKVAELYDFKYHRPQSPAEFVKLLNQPGQHLIEIIDDQQAPVKAWQAMVKDYQGRMAEHHAD